MALTTTLFGDGIGERAGCANPGLRAFSFDVFGKLRVADRMWILGPGHRLGFLCFLPLRSEGGRPHRGALVDHPEPPTRRQSSIF